MKRKTTRLMALLLALCMTGGLLTVSVRAGEQDSGCADVRTEEQDSGCADARTEEQDSGCADAWTEEQDSSCAEAESAEESAETAPELPLPERAEEGEGAEAEAPEEEASKQPEEHQGAEPVLTLNESDPCDYTTLAGKELLLQQAASYPSAFDLRDKGCVTSVKLQDPFGSCWGFAAIGAAESSLLGSGLAAKEGYNAKTLDLSEKHLAYFAATYLDNPGSAQHGEGTHHWDTVSAADILDIGGTTVLATNAFASGVGPVYESVSKNYRYRGKAGKKQKEYIDGSYQDYCYSADDDWSLDPKDRFTQSFVLSESYMLPSPNGVNKKNKYSYNPAGTAAIKEQLMNRRGVEIGYCSGKYMSSNWAHYTWKRKNADHAVEIVGWDDNYPRENFTKGHQPPKDLFPEGRRKGAKNGGNGAWLVKNSWGSGEEQFPNNGGGDWGLLKGQDKGVYNANTGKYEYKAKKNAPHIGYFWLSYYDQSISTPEALAFDKANQKGGYLLNQYDYMQVNSMWASGWKGEAKMANVFKLSSTRWLNEVSCQTTRPDTHVTYEIYLLPDNFANPEDGVLVASMQDDYQYGGFHKKAVRTVGAFSSDQLLLQRGQRYSIVVTMRTADGNYAISTPIGYGDGEHYQDYDVGIINPKESFVMVDGEWFDYSDEEVRERVVGDPGIECPAYDNFPIKGFCSGRVNSDKDLRASLDGDTDIALFRGQSYNYQLTLSDGSSSQPVQSSAVRWSLAEGGDACVSLSVSADRRRATLTPRAPGKTYLMATVDGVGTAVKAISVYRNFPYYFQFADGVEEGIVYTGRAIVPAIQFFAYSDGNILLEEGREYTIQYRNNVKCGAGIVTVTGAGELDREWTTDIPFPILPPKTTIKKLGIAPGEISVVVQNQKETGITGYQVWYCPKGKNDWKWQKFQVNKSGTDNVRLYVRGLNAAQQYEIRVAGFVSIPEEYRWNLEPSYTGEADTAVSVLDSMPRGTTISALKKGKNSITVYWKQQTEGVEGYQIQYSTSKNFSANGKTITVKKQKTSCTLNNLSSGKQYYVKIRTYKTVSGQELCSAWSGVKSIVAGQ